MTATFERLANQAWSRIPSAKRDRALRVLAYHGVSDASVFSLQMEYLSAAFVPVSADQVIGALRGQPLPRRAVWVTFDDADPSVIDAGLPILTNYEVPATLFVCPGVVDTDQPYWWQVVERGAEYGIEHDGSPITLSTRSALKTVPDHLRREAVGDIERRLEDHTGTPPAQRQISSQQLAAWVSSGNSLGNHTWDHPLLDMCDPAESERQVRRAHDWFEDKLGHQPIVFAYPNGNWDMTAESELRNLGYRVGLLFDHRFSDLEDPLRMSRLRTNAHGDLDRFRAILSGLHPFVHRLRRLP